MSIEVLSRFASLINRLGMAMTTRITVKIDDYLVQNKLSKALQAIVGATAWKGTEVRVISERRRRWDMVYQGDFGQVAVEFDGDAHYRDSLKIKADLDKDELARLGGYRVVRIPYWVQFELAPGKRLS
jgi:hypothetical protein